MPASQKDPDGSWRPTAETGPVPRADGPLASAHPGYQCSLLSMGDPKNLQKRYLQLQREINRLKQKLHRKVKALAAVTTLLMAPTMIQAYCA